MTSMIKPMDRARVEELLDRYGADTERFPAAERAAAKRLLETDPALRTQLDEARMLDALLDSSPTAEPSAALMRRVAEIPLHHPKPVRATSGVALVERPFQMLRAALAGAFAAAMGVILGLQTLPATSVNSDGVASVGEATGDDEDFDSDALVALAFADDFLADDVLLNDGQDTEMLP